jgi:malonyl CoA-acyl carrier protein transacylase
MAVTAAAPRSTTPSLGWDTEVFALRGDDRAHLRERALALAEFLRRHPGVTPADLAFTLATDLAPGGARLAAVADSTADLLKKLGRATDRLADPNCQQVRDAAGVYFAEAPLYTQGTLALLYPGEGAQYTNMLADLCGVFPEVEDTFAWCDRIAEEAGRPESSLRRILHPPAGATADEKAAAEAELRKLGASIFGVLVADLAITRVLENLRVPVSAIAGHSAGELAALVASGAMRNDAILGPKLGELMGTMQRQEDEAGGPDVALLAVGAGKPTVVEIAAAVSGGAVIVAMDNCPHQCVAVGPTHAVAAVEAVLAERGVICERLPFRRPYHTPLFEPWMGPFRELFAGVPFEPPHTPVYCCSTGARFPADPDAIRALAVNHWVTPVEFVRMVEAMYADGVRVFVEAGPRGNLSAFAEDVLRGRPFAAIPANLPRKSGPTQINHLVAQLVAHQVSVNLGHLYAGRELRAVEWEQRPGPAVTTAGLSGGNPLMDGYLAVMEQFLDVQREVMEAYLSGRAPHTSLPPDAFTLPDFTEPEPAAAPPFALIGTVERLEPGRSIVTRRAMDAREDLYADEHTLGGRGVSHVNPGQNGLPVVPMTFSLEAMAEAASLLVPGKVVVGLRDVRLFRWLPFDPEPTTLEVRAAVAAAGGDGTVEVKADVRDLGNSFVRDGANKPACEAVVVLADRHPDPPPPKSYRRTDEQPCRSTVADLRQNMFHGPLFQMVRTLDRCCKEGIEGTLEVQPRTGWFRSNPDPRFVIDPVLFDAAMHIMGAWHLEQPDWAGRILLPIGMSRLEFFGPPPEVGAWLNLRAHNEEETARQVRHGLEIFRPDGSIWLRLTGASYWRFYLPFGHVNFFGPKDEYFLSRDWPEACGRVAAEAKRAGETPGLDHLARSPEHSAAGRCYFLDPPPDLKQPVLRAAGVRVSMTAREQAEFAARDDTDAARNDWFFTRLVAKDAVRAAWYEQHGEAMFPADMEAETDSHGRVVCRPRGGPKAEPFPPVSVAVVRGKVAAFSAFAKYVGIALELLPKGSGPDAEAAARERAACRAVADALRVSPDGLTAAAAGSGSYAVSLARAVLAHYPDLGGRVRVRTARQKDVVVATTVCEAFAR